MHLPDFPRMPACSVSPAPVAFALIAVLIAASLGACAASAGNGSESMPQPVDSQLLPEALRADAARRGKVAAGEVQLLGREPVTWRDGSLGCPQPDRNYTQALVPGYRVRVRAGQELLTYHADRRGRWVWCPPERAVEPLDPASR